MPQPALNRADGHTGLMVHGRESLAEPMETPLMANGMILARATGFVGAFAAIESGAKCQ